MKKLEIKLDNFSEGKKAFFREDGTYEISEEETLPESFSFGVEMPKLNGLYLVESSIGTFALIISGLVPPTIIDGVELTNVFIAATDLGVSKISYPTTLEGVDSEKPEIDSSIEVITYTSDGGYAMAYTRDSSFTLELIKRGPDGDYQSTVNLFELEPPYTEIDTLNTPQYKPFPANVLGVITDSSYWYVYVARTRSAPYLATLIKASFTDPLDQSSVNIAEGSDVFSSDLGLIRENLYYTNSKMNFDSEGNIILLVANKFLAKFSRNLDLLYNTPTLTFYVADGVEYTPYLTSFVNIGSKYYLPCGAYAEVISSGDGYYRTVILEIDDLITEFSINKIHDVFTPYDQDGFAGWGYHDVHSGFISEGTLYGVGTVWSSFEYGNSATTGLLFAYDLVNNELKYWREDYDLDAGEYVDFYEIGRLSNYIYAAGWSGNHNTNDPTLYVYLMENGNRVTKMFPDHGQPVLTNPNFYSKVV